TGLHGQLARKAIRAIAAGQVERLLGTAEVDDEELRRLADHFRAERQEDLLSAGLRGTRAMGHLFFGDMENGRLSFADLFASFFGATQRKPTVAQIAHGLEYRCHLADDHAYFLRKCNEALAIALLPGPERLERYREFDSHFSSSWCLNCALS